MQPSGLLRGATPAWLEPGPHALARFAAPDAHGADATAAERAELATMVDTLRFVAPAG